MALTFDHAAKLIGVPQADAQPLTLQTLINAIRDEEASERGIVNPAIATAAGKDNLGGGAMTGITVALTTTWMLNFATGSYQATLSGGNLSDALSRIYNTGSPQVLIQSSAAATVISGSGGSAPSAAQVADAVWLHTGAVTVINRLTEAWGRLGLDAAKPLTQDTTHFTFGDIVLAVAQVGNSVTVARQ